MVALAKGREQRSSKWKPTNWPGCLGALRCWGDDEWNWSQVDKHHDQPRPLCTNSRKCSKGRRTTALMTFWRALRRRSKENWKMHSWTWSSALRTSHCTLLYDCMKGRGYHNVVLLESWSPKAKWTCWKSVLNSSMANPCTTKFSRTPRATVGAAVPVWWRWLKSTT